VTAGSLPPESKKSPLQIISTGSLILSEAYHSFQCAHRTSYLALSQPPTNAPLFITRGGTPCNRGALRLLTKRLGERAGVPDCHPHRFRHTFAIQFLRNNGTNIFALQAALGYTSLDMVKKYLSIIQADPDTAYETASPVANWKL
jgi:site-specific recombinase XerD